MARSGSTMRLVSAGGIGNTMEASQAVLRNLVWV